MPLAAQTGHNSAGGGRCEEPPAARLARAAPPTLHVSQLMANARNWTTWLGRKWGLAFGGGGGALTLAHVGARKVRPSLNCAAALSWPPVAGFYLYGATLGGRQRAACACMLAGLAGGQREVVAVGFGLEARNSRRHAHKLSRPSIAHSASAFGAQIKFKSQHRPPIFHSKLGTPKLKLEFKLRLELKLKLKLEVLFPLPPLCGGPFGPQEPGRQRDSSGRARSPAQQSGARACAELAAGESPCGRAAESWPLPPPPPPPPSPLHPVAGASPIC